MSLQREGGSLACPPVLDGTNYSYWKQMMEIYLTSIDGRSLACNSAKQVEMSAISRSCFKMVASRWARLRAKEVDGGEERTEAATKVGRS